MSLTDTSNATLEGNVTQLAGCLDNSLVPYVGQLLVASLSDGMRVLYGFAIASTLVTVALYAVRATRDRPPHDDVGIFRSHLVLVALPMVVSVCNVCGVLVPRALVIVALVQNAFFSYCISRFLSVIVRLLGGREKMLRRLSGKEMLIGRALPGCGRFCGSCWPRPKYDSKKHRILCYCIYQYCVLQPIISFLAAVLNSNGSYTEGYVDKLNAYIYLKIVQVVSMLICMHCLTIIKLMAQPQLEPDCPVGHKFLVLKVTLLLINLQSLLFGVLARLDVFPCTRYFSSATRSSYFLSFALIFEMLLLCCFTVFVAYPFSEKLDRHYEGAALTEESDGESSGDVEGRIQKNGIDMTASNASPV